MSTVTPGHEVVVMQRNGAWVNVFANTDEKEESDAKPEFEDPGTNPDPVPAGFATRASSARKRRTAINSFTRCCRARSAGHAAFSA